MKLALLKPYQGGSMNRLAVFIFLGTFLLSLSIATSAFAAKLPANDSFIQVTDNGVEGLNLSCNFTQSEHLSIIESELPVTLTQTQDGREIP